MDNSGATQSRGRGRPRKDIPIEKTQQFLNARLNYTQIGRIMKVRTACCCSEHMAMLMPPNRALAAVLATNSL